MELLHTSYFTLFLIILIGFIIGRIKIKGATLAAVLTFSSGAMTFGVTYLIGIELFLYEILITLVPMIITTFIAVNFMKFNILTLLGTLTESMTGTPGLATVDNSCSNMELILRDKEVQHLINKN
jgi:uncharacterized transporter YbjL